ncbi:NADAR family protein [Lyngbya confervoides]|uniref:NADAR family protein n=1 Tax=Lyngbya confervoides BDU141951 TaxID=1574623 RepID=A0ABD4T2N2_9CYAN|nr:NADAR family protein [Lyngbya confervoides]MCM1982789.1 NADAR family protein [Lyngbya confervoides BDU141951]
MTIRFYKVEDPYGCFSNFSPHPIVVEGVHWPTSEHYYQAQKFVGTPHADRCEIIRQAATPEEAAALGRDPQVSVRPDWDEVKRDVMYRAVQTKFSEHAQIRSVLLDTGDEQIVEDSPRDWFWGWGADHQGENHLGKILMEVRDACRRHLSS